ncbi:MAG: hypothetical protein IJ666_02445 [Ruminococcus sp.]|nr:hypothetical protein [Ruminococcus sp.]
MKNITRKIIAVAALLCVAASSIASCGSSSKNNNSETSGNSSAVKNVQQETEAPVLQFPFEIGTVSDEDEITADEDINAADPTEAASQSSEENISVEVEKVTDEKGQVVTEVVPVTEAGGQPVTNASGEQQTQVVEVTTVYVADGNKNQGNNNSSNSGSSSNSGTSTTSADEKTSSSSYTPNIDGRYAMWLDISKDENFLFEGPFIKLTFKVKDDAPDNDYKVRISPDLSNIAGQTVNPGKVTDGTIRVNKGDIDPADDSDTADNYYYGDNIACKQGDTIEYYLNVKNNTGLAAFCVWFYYDKNALELVSAEPTGEFEEIAAQSPEFGAAATKAAE